MVAAGMRKPNSGDWHLESSYTVSLTLEGRKVIGELEAQMLRAVDQTGSFSEAARTIDVSYAFLWNTIAQIERSVRKKIVYSERGGVKGGRAVLTGQGRRLLRAYSDLDSRVQQFLMGNTQVQAYGSVVHPNLTFTGSHCVVVEKALRRLHNNNPRMTYQVLNVGSWAGLTAMMLRQADLAGIHIFDEEKSSYNEPFLSKFGLSRSCTLVRGYERQQCLMIRKGNPKNITEVDDLLRKDVKLANRNLGSGTRILLDRKLRELATTKGVDFEMMTRQIRGYDSEMMTHRQVAAAVAFRRADVGIGLTSIAVNMKLDFVPFAEELYDFLVEKRVRNPHVRGFFDILRRKEFQKEVEATPGVRFLKESGQVVA
jgi:molybdate transport repressor ModE-like protein